MSKSSARIVRRVMNRANWVLMMLVVNHVVAGLLFTLFEPNIGIFEGQWWATVTGFTVGYGDFFPETTVGRIVGMIYIPSMALLWLVLGAHVVAAIIEDKNLFSNEEQERMEAALLELCQERGIVPPDYTQLPPLDFWKERHGFTADE